MVNRSLPSSQQAATPQEVSYTNMWLMSTVDSITWGELPGTGARGAAAADVGYAMLDKWLAYTHGSGVHEFTSPTYTYVQLSALYTGYIHARRPGYRGAIGRALDTIWADTCANTFAPHGALSGPHSRDYDTLLGHGMLLMEMYLWGLPGVRPLRCEARDPHCEGPPDNKPDTGEPMTISAVSLYNAQHPKGYRPPQRLLDLASLTERVVTSRFLGGAVPGSNETVTANGNEARLAATYNWISVAKGVAMGSASQDYVTNTHTKYFPMPQDKLVNILLGDAFKNPQRPSPGSGGARGYPRPRPAVTLQPDWMDSPYGIWRAYAYAKGTSKTKPGCGAIFLILSACLRVRPMDEGASNVQMSKQNRIDRYS